MSDEHKTDAVLKTASVSIKNGRSRLLQEWRNIAKNNYLLALELPSGICARASRISSGNVTWPLLVTVAIVSPYVFGNTDMVTQEW